MYIWIYEYLYTGRIACEVSSQEGVPEFRAEQTGWYMYTCRCVILRIANFRGQPCTFHDWDTHVGDELRPLGEKCKMSRFSKRRRVSLFDIHNPPGALYSGTTIKFCRILSPEYQFSNLIFDGRGAIFEYKWKVVRASSHVSNTVWPTSKTAFPRSWNKWSKVPHYLSGTL